MIELIFKRRSVIERHRNAPMVVERERYLSNLLGKGVRLRQVTRTSSMLLNVVQFLHLDEPRTVEWQEVLDASRSWTLETSSSRPHLAHSGSSHDFQKCAKKWLRFLSLLSMATKSPVPFSDLLERFCDDLGTQKKLQACTIRSHRERVSTFLRWLSYRRSDLRLLSIEDLEEYRKRLSSAGHAISTIATDCQRVRTFLRWTESCGLTRPALATGLISPRVHRMVLGSGGPSWSSVRRLITFRTGNKKSDLRARALISVLAIYALRGKEVRELRLDDIDWREETLTVVRGKTHRIQRFPLRHEVGFAILDYLGEARPPCASRNLFVSLIHPYHPLSQSAIQSIIAPRMRALKIGTPSEGSHALRHSCATHLLERGVSFLEIADFLGHSNTNTVAVYAKPSAGAMREVGNFSLEGVL